jgi:glucosamine kinase
MRFFLGMDAGGTRTTCAVGDGSSVLGRGEAGSCKRPQVSPAAAGRELRAALTAACKQGGVSAKKLATACVGMAGASDAKAAAALRSLVAGLTGARVEVVADVLIAHHAAFAGRPGVVVIAGTGSIAYGRDAQGRSLRAGGWGPAVSDAGSGQWIGRGAVGAVLRSFDARGKLDSPLARRLLEAWKAADAPALAVAAGQAPPAVFAQLVPQVLAAAAEGDASAKDLLGRAGSELALLAHTVMRRLWPGGEAVEIAICGGVFEHCALVRRTFTNAIVAERPDVRLLREAVEPVLGALDLARRAAARPGTGKRRP